RRLTYETLDRLQAAGKLAATAPARAGGTSTPAARAVHEGGREVRPHHRRALQRLETAPRSAVKSRAGTVHAGARLSEVGNLLLTDLDMNTESVRFRGKGAKDRRLRFGPKTARALSKYLRARAKQSTGRAAEDTAATLT
ncbi:hypothetical protein AB0H83_14090, partial [Dactylosporangium sp. NPDC050688]